MDPIHLVRRADQNKKDVPPPASSTQSGSFLAISLRRCTASLPAAFRFAGRGIKALLQKAEWRAARAANAETFW
jgi:hypothetical protein